MRRYDEPPPRAYRIAAAILRTAIRLLRWRVDIAGEEHLPTSGPVLVVANHVSYLDPILLGLAIDGRGRMVRFLAKREMFDHWFTGPVVRGADQIPVDRQGDRRAALYSAEKALSDGKLLVIYPEGTIHPTFDHSNAKTGAARLALACSVSVLPAVAWGGQQIGTKGRSIHLGFRSSHVVRLGAPLRLDPGLTVPEATERIMDAVAALLVEAAAAHPRDLGPPLATD